MREDADVSSVIHGSDDTLGSRATFASARGRRLAVAGGLALLACVGCGGGGGGGGGVQMADDVSAGSSGQNSAPAPGSSGGGPTTTPGAGEPGPSGGGGPSPSPDSPPPSAPGPSPEPPPGAAPAPEPTPPIQGRVEFTLDSSGTIQIVRVYVGTASRRYDSTFDLTPSGLAFGTGILSSTSPELASFLSSPGEYFVALTAVDASGRESELSNELRLAR